MSHDFDEFSKSLATEVVSRRDSFRLLGAALAGSVLAPFGLRNASAGAADPCKAFCNKCPKSQRPRCLTACRACNNDPSRLCTDCWSYSCCDSGETCCGRYTCQNLADDFHHCGACYNVCAEPGPFENGACISGRCEYWCVDGAVLCDGECSLLDRDPDNCGACGNVCPDASPVCINGTCSECLPGQTNCGGYCAYLASDPYNCGACGFVCPGTSCADGECDFGTPPE
jgi:hypothetical protein